MLNENISEKNFWNGHINITKEQWIYLLNDRSIITEEDFQIIKLIYTSDDHMATASQLARLLNMPHYLPINSQIGRLGKRIVKNMEDFNIQAIKKKHGEGFNWFNVPFLGMATREGYYWILRPELKDAMEEILQEDRIKIPEEIDLESYKDLYEGARKQIYVNIFERNKDARKACLKYYGTTCVICNFDFEKKYGKAGRNIIHVHHLKPLSEIGATYRVDPIKDLRPVCPNCHLIIHMRNPPYSIDDVATMIKDNERC